MARFLVVGDAQHKAFINIELVCMFRYRHNSDGSLAYPLEVEIEYIGGGRTKLFGETAKHFLDATSKLLHE